MTPGQIIALVRDAIIVIGIGLLLWMVRESGKNADIKEDMKAMQKQLQLNAQLSGKWESERITAEAQRYADMQTVTNAINSHREPVRLCNAPSPGGVSPSPSTPAGDTSGPRRLAEGPGEDIRPAINAFAIKYESYLAACRTVLAQWPKE